MISRGERGISMVEAVFALPLFLFLLLLTFNLLRLGYAAIVAQFSTSEILREATVGPNNYGGKTQGEYINSAIRARASQLGVTLEPTQITICVFQSDMGTRKQLGCGAELSGGAGNFVSVASAHSLNIPLLGTYTVTGIAYGKNELWE